MTADLKSLKSDFADWLKGPGEAMYGGIIKAAASNVARRIRRRLETPNLFPHIEHEDRAELEKCKQAHERGEKMVQRGRARNETIKTLTEADAGLKITADDLAGYPQKE